MKTWVICGRNIYSRQEKAREILFNKVSPKEFVLAFEFDGKEYYRKVK